jgi:hypothetical protein
VPARVRVSSRPLALPQPRVLALFLAAPGAFILAGYATVLGYEVPLLASIVLVGILLRPQAALVIWVGGLLASGQELTHLHATGTLYVTEPLLALLTLAIAVQILTSDRPAPGLKTMVMLNLALWTPALGGLLLRTNTGYLEWLPNFTIVYYALFAIAAAALVPSRQLYRGLFLAVLVGSLIAFVLVFLGLAGADQERLTSTGATRIAHGSFSLPFGIAPLVLIAAVRERVLSPWWLAPVPPLLLALVLENQRSAWLGFALALVVLLSTRVTPKLLFAAMVLVLAGSFFVEKQTSEQGARLQTEVIRARSLTDTSDPNARFRLQFWKAVGAASLESPLFGSGFDPYPSRLIPPETAFGSRQDPHNSFVALAYRVGPIALGILVAMLSLLLLRGYRSAHSDRDPLNRAVTGALVAVIAYVAVYAALNVTLELPYAAPLFWVPVGLLATATGRLRR